MDVAQFIRLHDKLIMRERGREERLNTIYRMNRAYDERE